MTSALYPELSPFAQGLLDVGDGHRLYWEVCGNPAGKPALVLHGGPGSGCSPRMRRYFDPQAYRIVLFDQRNSGRSTPHASAPAADLSTNTTHHLIADIEHLRQHLDIERWLVYGGSWGSTLALAYAERFPQRVTEMIIPGVTMTRRSEIDWLYHGVAPLFPAQWARFRNYAVARAGERNLTGGDLVAAYYRPLNDPNRDVRQAAAHEWCTWENALASIDPKAAPDPSRTTPEFELAFARIVTHYFHHAAWLEEGILLREAHRLAGIPALLIHGRFDVGAPLVTAWELAQAWPDAELVIVQGAGHSTGDPGMPEAIRAATDRFADRSADRFGA